jgi:hypothetical protein
MTKKQSKKALTALINFSGPSMGAGGEGRARRDKKVM